MKFDKNKLSIRNINKHNFRFQITYEMNIQDLLDVDADFIQEIKELNKTTKPEEIFFSDDIEYLKEVESKLIHGISEEDAISEFFMLLTQDPNKVGEYMVDNKVEKLEKINR